jgi:hypothetical protein
LHGLDGTFILNPGHTLMKFFQLRRLVPPGKGIKASRLVLSQPLLTPFKVRLPHRKNELAPTQNPIKV